MKTTDYINCKIIKYQRGDRVQRRDAIKDYRPQIQEPIKQQYTPTYSEISQDNRSEWEKEVSRQIKAIKLKMINFMVISILGTGLHHLPILELLKIMLVPCLTLISQQQ